jgi:hypothetical protein
VNRPTIDLIVINLLILPFVVGSIYLLRSPRNPLPRQINRLLTFMIAAIQVAAVLIAIAGYSSSRTIYLLYSLVWLAIAATSVMISFHSREAADPNGSGMNR